MYYAGIGSRDCPEDIGVIMTELAGELEKAGYVLRSGGARGADTFFERGVIDPRNKQVFIHDEPARGKRHDPRSGIYNAKLYANYPTAVKIASEVHGHWQRCSQVAREMHARNVYQVLGQDLADGRWSSCVICWAVPDIHGVPEGGTRTAWLVAERYGIKRYNLAVRADRDRVETWLALRKAA